MTTDANVPHDPAEARLQQRDPRATAHSQRIKAAVASTVGTTIEWYDFFLYGTAAALVFPKIFFPNESPLSGTLLSFSTLFVGFAARPIGAAIFGHVGDPIGPEAALTAHRSLLGGANAPRAALSVQPPLRPSTPLPDVV